MANTQNGRQGHRNAPREFFTLGEHAVGNRHYRFRYDGRVYRILDRLVRPGDEDTAEEAEETLLLEEENAPKAYEAWNRIKRPERFGL